MIRVEQHFCHRLGCKGTLGFPVRWMPESGPSYASGGDPAYPVTDSCPHCHHQMHSERLEWGDALLAFLDDLKDGGADLDPDEIDHWALAAAIQSELDRQATARFQAKRNAEFPPHDIPAWLTTGASK